MLKRLTPLQTASALALVLALPAFAQEAAPADTTEGEAATTEAPAEATTEAPATPDAPAASAPAGEADAAAESEAAATGEAAGTEGEAAEGETVMPEGETTDAQATDSEAPAQAAPQGDVDRNTVVASVNGTDITLGEIMLSVSQLPAQYQQLPPDILFGGVVDQIIQQELLAQTVTEEPGILPLALANQRRSILANEAIAEVLAGAVTDEAVQAAYDETYAAAEPQTEWNASHILVATEEEAQAVIERLDAGEDFAAVAQEVSTDAGSGAQGGELGWFGPGMMVPEFEQGVAGLENGAVSAPIQSQFGFHIIRLNETRPQEAPALDQVRGEIEAQLQQEAVEAYLTELEAGAQVTRPEPGQFDPMILANPSILED